MQTYRCVCGNRIFFENTCCLACHRDIGWCEACSRMTSFEPTDDSADAVSDSFRCSPADCRQPLRKCHNYLVENVCNRCFVSEPGISAQGNAPITAGTPA